MKKERVDSFALTCKRCKEKSKGNIHFILPWGIYLQCLECGIEEFLSAPQTKQMSKRRQVDILRKSAN